MAEPDWSDLKYLLALDSAGSVAGAARVLGVDQSTVSRRLAALEAAFGAVLVIRGGREFSFTDEGRVALDTARAMQAMTVHAQSAIRAARTEVEGLVRVSAVPGLVGFLTPFQVRLAAEHPRLTVEISSDVGKVDLARGDADIALRMRKVEDPDLIARQVFEIGFCVYASKAYAAKYGLPQDREGLRGHRLVLNAKAFAALPQFNWIDVYASPGMPLVRADGPDMAFNLVRSGEMIGIIDCHRGDAAPELVRVFPAPTSFVPGHVVWHESQKDTARIKVVVQALITFLKANAGRISGRNPAPPDPAAE